MSTLVLLHLPFCKLYPFHSYSFIQNLISFTTCGARNPAPPACVAAARTIVRLLLLFRKVLRHGAQFLGPGATAVLLPQNGVAVLLGGHLAVPRQPPIKVALQTQNGKLGGIQIVLVAAHVVQGGDRVPPFPVKVGVFRGVVPAVAQVGGGAVRVADLQHGGEADGLFLGSSGVFVFVTVAGVVVAGVWVCGWLLLGRLMRGNHGGCRPYGLAARG